MTLVAPRSPVGFSLGTTAHTATARRAACRTATADALPAVLTRAAAAERAFHFAADDASALCDEIDAWLAALDRRRACRYPVPVVVASD